MEINPPQSLIWLTTAYLASAVLLAWGFRRDNKQVQSRKVAMKLRLCVGKEVDEEKEHDEAACEKDTEKEHVQLALSATAEAARTENEHAEYSIGLSPRTENGEQHTVEDVFSFGDDVWCAPVAVR